MTRRLSTFVAALTLVASLFGLATPVAASPPKAAQAPTVAQVNAPPVAVDDPPVPACNPTVGAFGGAFPIPEDWGPFDFFGPCSATTNDSDSDGSIASWAIDVVPGHGSIEWLPNQPGIFRYTPDADYSTLAGDLPGGQWISDSFTYHVVDNQGASSNQATYRFWIAPVNDPPVFVSPPASVTVGRNTGPYDADWSGYASPGPANESDQHVTFVIDGVDQTGVPNLFSVPPAFTANGHLTFTPGPGQVGLATVTVHLHDDGGLEDYQTTLADPPDDTSDSITFTIVVDNLAPVAVDDTADVLLNSAANAIDVRANDSDANGDPLQITARTDGALGSVAITGGGTGLTYTPATDAVGADSFTYTIDDGHGGSDTATVNVFIDQPPDAVNDAPNAIAEDAGATAIDVLANDTDPDPDTLTITGTTDGAKGAVAITNGGADLAYTPDPNANGSDSFTYTISDGHGGSDTATVEVTIDPINDAPIAVTDTLTVVENQATASTVLVLANDTDVEGDTLAIIAKSNGAKGAVVTSLDGKSVTYKPNANAFGSDSFTYTVDDGHGGSTIGTVNVTISATNDRPNAVNDGVPTPIKVYLFAGAKSIPVLANDTYLPDAPETLRITKFTQGAHGKVTITGSGTGLTYTPTGTTTGIDVFKYTISDGHGGTDTASVQVTVGRDTTAPKATITGLTNTAITGSTKRRLTVTWAFTETQSGIRSEQLQRRTDSGSWVTVTLSSSSIRSASFSFSKGHTYAFRVRATDRAGNVGLYVGRSLRI